MRGIRVVLACPAGALMESKGITALGHFQHQMVVNPLRRVILSQFCAKTARLDPYHGIQMRVEVFLASEDFGGDLVLLWGYPRMLEGVVCQILEKLAEGLRAMEGTASEKLLDLGELLGSVTHPTISQKRVWRHCNTNVTRFASLCAA